MSTRRQAREIAFQFVYSRTAASPRPDREDFLAFCRNFDTEFDAFAWEIASGTLEAQAALDEGINAVSKNWRVERMPKVDLAILRMGAYEIQHRSDVPKSVAINEAIELAKKFGAEGSPAFVNGILDKMERKKA